LDYLTTHTSISPIRRGFAPGFVNCKKGAIDTQPQVIKFTSCLPMDSGTPTSSTTKTGPRDIAKILLKVTLSTINQITSFNRDFTLHKRAITSNIGHTILIRNHVLDKTKVPNVRHF
jgi:hypothetical protein